MAQAGTLTGIAAGMMTRSAEAIQAGGVLGSTISGISEQMKEQTSLLNARDQAESKLLKNQKDMETIRKKMNVLLKMERDQLFKFPGDAERVKTALKKLREAEKDLRDEKVKSNEEWEKSNKNLEAFSQKTSFWASGAKMMIGKLAGIATAYFSWRKAMDSVDFRLKMSARSITDMGVALNTTTGGIQQVWNMSVKWDAAINDTVKDLRRFGIRAEEAKAVMSKLSDGLAMTTRNQQTMIESTQQMTKDIGFLSKLIGMSTDELAEATVKASQKFGTSTTAMTQDLTQMYYAITNIKKAAPDVVMNIRQLTKQALEAQASFQGYNLNLRTTASVLGEISRKAQEQGASLQGATAAATQMFDILTGQKAPDWAKYMAGDKLRDEVKKMAKGVNLENEEGMAKFRENLATSMGEDVKNLNEQQLKNLKDLAVNWKEYGDLSSANMTQELLAGTTGGMKAMLKLMKQTTKGPEMREALKAIWGLDDQAATAAALGFREAFQSEGGIDDFMKQVAKLKEESGGRKPPTIADLRQQTEGIVEAVGKAEAGIMGTIAAYWESVAENPVATAIIGAIGAGSSTMLQAITSGAAQGVAGKLFGGGGKAMLGAGILTGSAAALKTAAAGGGLGASAAAAGGGAAGVGAVALPVAVAAGAGVVMGSLIRLIPGVDQAAQSFFNFHAKLLNLPHSMDKLEEAQKSLAIVLQSPELKKSLDIQADVARGRIKDERAQAVAARQLADLANEDLIARAKAMVQYDKQHNQLIRSEEEQEKIYQARLVEMRATGQQDRGKALPEAAKPEAEAQQESPASQRSAEKTAKEAAVTAAQTQQVKTDESMEKIREEAKQHQKRAADVAGDFWKKGMPKASSDAWKKMSQDFNTTIQDMVVAYIASLPGGAMLLEKMGRAAFQRAGSEIRGGRGHVDAEGNVLVKVPVNDLVGSEATREAAQ